MWNADWRESVWSQLDQPWDLIIIGGGIIGAGILREAVRLGLRVLLVERHDFAWGTSSRSSKLVHGGIRYLKEGRIFLTRASVQERERLLEEGPGLIDPLGFLLTVYEGDSPGRWTFEAGLSIYDLLALQWGHRYYNAEDFQMLAPHIAQRGLEGGFRYGDAQTDDARLVLRVIREAVKHGGTALNYVKAEELLKDDGRVVGVRLRENIRLVGSKISSRDRRAIDVHAPVIINATGAWADQLRKELGAEPRIRPLRGSHLIFPSWRLPVAQAVSFLHPLDHRPVFIFPWEGVTIVGTTDVDHDQPLDVEPRISPEEVAYLMAAAEDQFPSLDLRLEDVISTYAGVRPVIGTGKMDPSKESRDHVVWEESGLLTIAGGKLTTFRLVALDVLDALHHRTPQMPHPSRDMPVLDLVEIELPDSLDLGKDIRRRLLGRYGADAPALVDAALPGELEVIPGTQTLWAELRWGARAEGVVYLDDLLMRRVRLGVLLPEGGKAIMSVVKTICQTELGWDDERWLVEEDSYMQRWQDKYSTPEFDLVPDWREQLTRAKTELLEVRSRQRKALTLWSALIGGITAAVLGMMLLLIWRGKRER